MAIKRAFALVTTGTVTERMFTQSERELSRYRRLKQFHNIARGILAQDLLSPRSLDDFVTERHALPTKCRHQSAKVGDLQYEAVPAARLWCSAVRHRFCR